MSLEFSTESALNVGRGGREQTDVKKGDSAPRPSNVIGPKTSCAAAFSILLEQAASQVITHRQMVMKTDDERGPHQMRVGLRRLRTLLRALRDRADSPSLRKFEYMAAEVAREVGKLRDADVLIGSIYQRVAEATDEPFLEALERPLREHRTSMQHAVRSMLRGVRWKHLQSQLDLWPGKLKCLPVLEQPGQPYATELLNKRWRRLKKIGRNLHQLNVEQRHEMRKALKKFRYLSEFFAPMYQREHDASVFLKQLKDVQDIFGYLTDVHMAAQLPELLKGASKPALHGAHYIVGWHESEAQYVWKRAGKMWNQVHQAPRFWIDRDGTPA